jgi:hypothetical protein
MKAPAQKTVVERITEYYLASSDFNGYPVRLLITEFGMDPKTVQHLLGRLINSGKISLITNAEENPHIKRFPDLSQKEQLSLLQGTDLDHSCAYPTISILKQVVDVTAYNLNPAHFERQTVIPMPE